MGFRQFLILGVAVLFVGCAQKVGIRFVQPAEIEQMSHNKKIIVASFGNDRFGVGSKIEAKLSNHKIEKKNYFEVKNNSKFQEILKKAKHTDITSNISEIAKIGELLDVDAIVLGDVGNLSSRRGYFYENRVRCADDKCKKMKRYIVRCVRETTTLHADMKIVDVNDGGIIYAKAIPASATYKHCIDDRRTIPNRSYQGQYLSEIIARDFVYKLMPHYRYVDVSLLEDGEFDYNDEQQRYLDVALEYVKQQRYKKAQHFFVKLIDATQQKSYVPFYNLGVLKESEGDYENARKYYKKADELMVEPVEEISRAVIRIEKMQQNKEKTKEQLR